MEKLHRYNQRLLAILGTSALAGILLLIFFFLFLFIKDISRSSRASEYMDNALTANTNENIETKKPKLQQEITFLSPRLIDTLKALYIVPVSQVNVGSKVQDEDPYIFSKSYKSRSYSYYQYSGSYNNIILFDQKNNVNTPVFDSKININRFHNYIIKDKQYLFITGTLYDSNKDGKLNESDLQTFFIYDISSGKKEAIGFEGMGLGNYEILNDTDEIVLSFGIDKNKNGEFDKNTEPTHLKKYSIAENKTVDFIDKEILDKLQNLIQ